MRHAMAILLALIIFPSAALAHSECVDTDNAVVANLSNHKLYLCRAGSVVKAYHISIGSGGVGKTSQGDEKTPVGTYALGEPRRSDKFHIFIPVMYPTETQKTMGYTGDSIGIHGPPPEIAWLGWLNTLNDVTSGCIMVGTMEEIEEIAHWVLNNRARSVYLKN